MWKGKKMAGQMGDRQRTTQHLEIARVDVARGLIMIKGAVPGAEGGYLYIKDAVRRPTPEGVPMPAAIRASAAAAAPAVADEAQPDDGEA